MAFMNTSSNLYNVSSSLVYRENSSTRALKNVIIVVLGLIINYINGTLIHTFRKHQTLYLNPRYILFIHLVLNDMIQLTSSIILYLLPHIIYSINASACCFIIIFAVSTTFNTPLNLAVMVVECYIAVCFPLRHTNLCTIKRTYALIGCIWALSALAVLPDIFLLIVTEPDRLLYSSVNCERDVLFRHPVSIKKRDVSYPFCLSVIWLVLIYSYFRIFLAAKAIKSVDGNLKKGRNTILLHGFQLILSMSIYIAVPIKDVLMKEFPIQIYLHSLYIWYIVIHILPRFISPIVYGLRDKTFKQYFRKHIPCTVRAKQTLTSINAVHNK